MGQLRALQNKLAERQRLIGNINNELGDIDNRYQEIIQRGYHRSKASSTNLKERYIQSLRYDYENRSSYDMLAFLFSAHDFNDAWRRMKYLKKVQRLPQAAGRADTPLCKASCKIRSAHSIRKNPRKIKLLNTQMQQKQVLVKETDQTNKVVNDLKGKESQLLKDIEKNRKTTASINRAISIV
jgi:hypothetical protein